MSGKGDSGSHDAPQQDARHSNTPQADDAPKSNLPRSKSPQLKPPPRFEMVRNLLGPLLALACVTGFFAIADFVFADGTFSSEQNFRTVAVQTCVVAVAALGMTIIIISGGIDLSAGTALALCATTLAWGLREDVAILAAHGTNYLGASTAFQDAQQRLAAAAQEGDEKQQAALKAEVESRRQTLLEIARLKRDQLRGAAESTASDAAKRGAEADLRQMEQRIEQLERSGFQLTVDPKWRRGVPNSPWSTPLALVIGVGTGLLLGGINGLLITSLRIVPFVVTLSTATIYLGIGNLISGNVPIRPAGDQVPDWLSGLVGLRPDELLLRLPVGVWLAVVPAVVVILVLRFSVFGRHVFAIGSSEATARLCGINVPATKIALYAVGGLLLGLAGVYQFARLSTGNPQSGVGLELQIIAAAVIGGASLNGGRGTVVGTLAGAATMAVIYSGCSQLGLSNAVTLIVNGIAILSAASIDSWRQRRAER